VGELKDKAKGYANDAVGNATGNQRLKDEGVAQEAKGEMQEAAGAVKGAMGNKV
jgi:uncharacterized protein YjbJ (UPF0337 family)